MSRSPRLPAISTGRRRWSGRAAAVFLTFVLLLGAGFDLSRPPASQWSAAAAVAAIHFYQRHLSNLAGKIGIGCRFKPTCSVYAETVIRQEGFLRGSARALWRIARCGPWTPAGTFDPPPPAPGEGRSARPSSGSGP